MNVNAQKNSISAPPLSEAPMPAMGGVHAVYQAIIHAIAQASHVVLISHRSPDGDTLGSSLALRHYIESLGKRATNYCVDEAPPYLQFLPQAHTVGPHDGVWTDPTVDLIIVLDTSDLNHAGVTEYINTSASISATHNGSSRPWPVIVIDHHFTNAAYGDINLINDKASSACELVYDILTYANAITQPIATCLLTGLVTDTGSFSNLATTSSSVHAASDLLRYGADIQRIARNTLSYRPFTTLKLWGRALERLHEDEKTGMIVTYITLNDIEECKADHEAVSGISNFLNSLSQSAEKAVLVLAQTTPGVIKGSLRTTSPLIDVSEFAKLHGGGGHKKAAGFTLNGTLQITEYGYEIIP